MRYEGDTLVATPVELAGAAAALDLHRHDRVLIEIGEDAVGPAREFIGGRLVTLDKEDENTQRRHNDRENDQIPASHGQCFRRRQTNIPTATAAPGITRRTTTRMIRICC